MDFCFATFCFGNRYYDQVNRFIDDIVKSQIKPILVVVTDNPFRIRSYDFVKVFNIVDLNPEYMSYSENYYDFDFSVKRYALRAAIETLGFTNVILTDADARVNYPLFTEDSIKNAFIENSISGPVTYTFSKEIKTNSELGKRLLAYEDHFGFQINKSELNAMPEDCVQYITANKHRLENFLKTWDECILYKKEAGLKNVPAGNIDEMCFSAIYNGMSVGNNSNKSLNIIYPQHDKWY